MTFLPPAPVYVAPAKWQSAGGVVCRFIDPKDLSGLEQVLICLPANGWNGGKWTFPKGRIEAGETPMQAAKSEIAEETGRNVCFFPHPLIGRGIGTCSITTYFLALDEGETGKGFDKETQEIRWVMIDALVEYFRAAKCERDLAIALKARRRIRRMQSTIRFLSERE